MPEKCPGCAREFADGDLTDMLPDPWLGGSKTNRLWHLHCHQNAHMRERRRLSAAINHRLTPEPDRE